MPLILSLVCSSCVSDPAHPADDDLVGDFSHGVLIVNEGLWRQDNSTLTYHDPATNRTVQDYFGKRNPGLRLGDTGNDIVVWNHRAYIVVSTSRTIEVLDLPSGTWAGRIRFPESAELRYMAIGDDSTGFVSTRDDELVQFDPLTFQAGRRISVGPAPEGVAVADGRVFVANSALGRLRQDEPLANTLSVIDPSGKEPTRQLSVGNNPWTIHFMPGTDRLYVLSRPLYPDSVGALVEIDPKNIREIRRWTIINPNPMEMAFDNSNNIAYVLGSQGVMKIILAEGASNPEIFIRSAPHDVGGFFDIGVSPQGAIYVSDARQYTTPGNVLVFSPQGEMLGRFESGLNPGAFGFY